MAANSAGLRMAATEPVTPRITRAMGQPLTWHNAEAPEEPPCVPCVPPSQGGKKDQTPPTFPPPLRRGAPTFPPLAEGGRLLSPPCEGGVGGVRAEAHAMHLKTALAAFHR